MILFLFVMSALKNKIKKDLRFLKYRLVQGSKKMISV